MDKGGGGLMEEVGLVEVSEDDGLYQFSIKNWNAK